MDTPGAPTQLSQGSPITPGGSEGRAGARTVLDQNTQLPVEPQRWSHRPQLPMGRRPPDTWDKTSGCRAPARSWRALAYQATSGSSLHSLVAHSAARAQVAHQILDAFAAREVGRPLRSCSPVSNVCRIGYRYQPASVLFVGSSAAGISCISAQARTETSKFQLTKTRSLCLAKFLMPARLCVAISLVPLDVHQPTYMLVSVYWRISPRIIWTNLLTQLNIDRSSSGCGTEPAADEFASAVLDPRLASATRRAHKISAVPARPGPSIASTKGTC